MPDIGLIHRANQRLKGHVNDCFPKDILTSCSLLEWIPPIAGAPQTCPNGNQSGLKSRSRKGKVHAEKLVR